VLEGRDVVAMARTGSGKTACFLIPMFEKLKMRSAKAGARALILSPTRELALQVSCFDFTYNFVIFVFADFEVYQRVGSFCRFEVLCDFGWGLYGRPVLGDSR
jgi:hypothetical protein